VEVFMATVLVAARCNLDRVWRLAMPLRPGTRHSYSSVEERAGGGGTYTGSALRTLGHAVRLAGTLADDDCGCRYRDALIAHGFDVAGLRAVHGSTIPMEILLDPLGERTIVAPAAVEHGPLAALDVAGADLVYANVRRVAPGLLEEIAAHRPVIAQVPLEAGERRACHWLVGSASDLAARLGDDPFGFARAIAGDRLEALVVTAGPDPVRIWTRTGTASVTPPTLASIADSSGAGDVFAGALADARLRGLGAEEAVAAANAFAVRFLADRSTVALPRI
jgi:sugar/nucleoside kinase (ribokinase family)